MSINDFYNKIKGKTGIDNTTIMYFLIIIGVGVGSFFLGTLSSLKKNEIPTNLAGSALYTEIDSTNKIIKNTDIDNSIEKEIIGNQQEERMYVASKNGKLYYTVNCSGANRIKEENKVWFASRIDAEKSGYTVASSCK